LSLVLLDRRAKFLKRALIYGGFTKRNGKGKLEEITRRKLIENLRG